MRRLPYLWLDVFADRPFSGNALCVVLDGSTLSDQEMQAIARETNLSETTFVLPPTEAGATYRCRIFTPGGELAFAGHPTLGTAAALYLSGRHTGLQVVQQSRYGLTRVELTLSGDRLERLTMEPPAPVIVEYPDPERVAAALRLSVEAVTTAGLRPAVVEAAVRHMLVPVSSPEVLGAIQPDTVALEALSRELNVIGAYPFALLTADETAHARARLFAPLFGIPEDPATGSAAAPLGEYMRQHGLLPQRSSSFWYEQGVEMGRPSRIWVDVHPDAVSVGGQVVLLGQGEFVLP